MEKTTWVWVGRTPHVKAHSLRKAQMALLAVLKLIPAGEEFSGQIL